MPRARKNPAAQAPAAAPAAGREFGAAAADLAAQEEVPLPQEQPPSRAPFIPPQLTGIGEPTTMPDQPIQAGIPSGPGPGPDALMMAGSNFMGLTSMEQYIMASGDPRARLMLERILSRG